MPKQGHNLKLLHSMDYDFSPESTLYNDAAYTNQETEHLLNKEEMIQLEVSRKSNYKTPKSQYAEYIIKHYRKGIETTVINIKNLFP